MEELLYTVRETAEILKTNKEYVYKIFKAGILPALKLGSLKVKRTSIIEFLEKFENKDVSDPDNILDLDYNLDEESAS